MKPAWLLVVGLAAAPLATSGFAQQMDFNKVQIITDQMAPNLYMLSGSGGLDPSHDDAAGGRIGVLAGPDGILMVDSQYAQLTDKVVEAIRRISAAPIRYLVNTHIHRDHTAGNANFARLGAMILAREELREGMVRISKSPNASSNPLSDPAGFPVITYGMGTPLKIRMNGEVVDLIPIRTAHTGGDTIIRFENANVIMIGDFYRNYGYPYIDIANGGSLKGMLEGLDGACRAGHEARPGSRHHHQARRHCSLSRHDFRRPGKGAAVDRGGQNPAGRAGREDHRAVRREGSRWTSAGRCRDERRPIRRRGISATQGRRLRAAPSGRETVTLSTAEEILNASRLRGGSLGLDTEVRAPDALLPHANARISRDPGEPGSRGRTQTILARAYVQSSRLRGGMAVVAAVLLMR
jgi:glyoxylase-like metal-dependent hydrolase (beta-lactamase superfamily II)